MAKRTTVGALEVSLRENAAAYRRVVRSGAAGDCWDYLVLTATNADQAEGYRQELARRQRGCGTAGAFFPESQKIAVVPDPPGPRIGSGGATLNALRYLVTELGLPAAKLPDLRILLIHSGGLSQRLPAYSPVGKIFSPLPLLRPDGQVATLFDHLYVTLAALPARLGPGLFTASGDVLILLDHRDVPRPPAGVSALTFPVAPDVASAHGVFVADARGRIRRTLQKVSPQQMRDAGATNAKGRALIDTGLFFFDRTATAKLATLAGLPVLRGARTRRPFHERHARPLDLYVDIVTALSSDGTPANPTSAPDKELRATFRGTPFTATVMNGQFLHLGTTRQFRDAMTGRSDAPAVRLLLQNVQAHAPVPLPADCRAFDAAFVGPAAANRLPVGRGAVIETSVLPATSRVGAGCMVSQVFSDRPLDVPDHTLFFQVPLRDGAKRSCAQVLCGVDDDFKGKFADGRCGFLNAPIDQWLARHGIRPRDLWPASVPAADRTLWTARLFPATVDRSGVDAVHWFASPTAAPSTLVARWRKSKRHSMSTILHHADHGAIIEHRHAVAAAVQAGELLDAIRSDTDEPADALLSSCTTAAAQRVAFDQLSAFAAAPAGDPDHALHQARAAWCAAQLAAQPSASDATAAEHFATTAFAKVVEASERAPRRPTPAARRARTPRPGLLITATAPARLDLSGGWSDTPPYCYERGGHVVNVAVDLDGAPPIVATARTIPEPKFVLTARDLGQSCELRHLDPEAAVDVADPFALHKVALRLAGLSPLVRGSRVGIEVTTECRLPKGSGLGTSSILAATLLAALERVAGRRSSPARLFDQTLLLEQRLSTGGGWQDQVGGTLGGIKSTLTAPGLPQRLAIERLHLPDALLREFEHRLVVYYSGQQRLARDILRRVMGRWLSREPAMVAAMDRLKRSAADLRVALLNGRWPKVAREIDRYWQTKKELYPGSTTPAVDALLSDLRGHYAAAGLAGAGGGGFGYFFCTDPRQAARLSKLLAERSSRPGSLGAVYAARVNRRGLVVKSGVAHDNPRP